MVKTDIKLYNVNPDGVNLGYINKSLHTIGHVIHLFIGVLGRWVDCASQIWGHLKSPNDLQMTSSDLKCKQNFLTKSHFWACYESFHRFFGKLIQLCLSYLNLCLSDFSSMLQNDLQMTSKWLKWPIMTWKHNSYYQI